MIETASTANG